MAVIKRGTTEEPEEEPSTEDIVRAYPWQETTEPEPEPPETYPEEWSKIREETEAPTEEEEEKETTGGITRETIRPGEEQTLTRTSPGEKVTVEGTTGEKVITETEPRTTPDMTKTEQKSSKESREEAEIPEKKTTPAEGTIEEYLVKELPPWMNDYYDAAPSSGPTAKELIGSAGLPTEGITPQAMAGAEVEKEFEPVSGPGKIIQNFINAAGDFLSRIFGFRGVKVYGEKVEKPEDFTEIVMQSSYMPLQLIEKSKTGTLKYSDLPQGLKETVDLYQSGGDWRGRAAKYIWFQGTTDKIPRLMSTLKSQENRQEVITAYKSGDVSKLPAKAKSLWIDFKQDMNNLKDTLGIPIDTPNLVAGFEKNSKSLSLSPEENTALENYNSLGKYGENTYGAIASQFQFSMKNMGQWQEFLEEHNI